MQTLKTNNNDCARTRARTPTQTPGWCLALAYVPAAEHSRPCRRDSCAGPSRPRPPAGRCGARGPSGSPCRVCGRARCVRSWSRAAPPRCRHTAKPASRGEENTQLGLSSRIMIVLLIFWLLNVGRRGPQNHHSGDLWSGLLRETAASLLHRIMAWRVEQCLRHSVVFSQLRKHPVGSRIHLDPP